MATETYRDRRFYDTEENSFLYYLTGPFARFLYALPFLVFGINHFAQGEAMAGMVPVPGGVFWIYLVGACLIAASIAIAFNVLRTWAGIGLAALLLTFVFLIHLPPILAEGMSAMNSVTGLLKDSSLAGAALYFAGHPHK